MFKFKNKINNFIIYLFPFTLPLPISLQIKSISLFLFLAYLIIKEKKKLKYPNEWSFFLILSIIFFLDPILSIVRDQIVFINDTRLSFFILPFLFVFFRINPFKYYKKIVYALLYGNIAYVMIITFSYFFSDKFKISYFIFKDWYHNSELYIHHIYSGLFILISIIQVYYTDFKFKNCMTGILILSIILVGSKFTLVVLVIIFIFLIENKKIKYYLLMVSVPLITLFYYILSINNDSLYWSSHTRIKIWKRVFSILDGNITLEGVKDVNQFVYIIGVGKYTIKERLMNYDTHNIFLQELLSNGIIGLSLVVLLFIYLTKKFKAKKENLAILLCFFLFGLIENLFELQIGVTCFVFYISILIFKKEVHSSKTDN